MVSVLVGGGLVFSVVCYPSPFTRRNSHKPEDVIYPVLSPFLFTNSSYAYTTLIPSELFLCLSFNLLFPLEGVQVTAVSI